MKGVIFCFTIGAALALGAILPTPNKVLAQCDPGWELVGEDEDNFFCSPIEEDTPLDGQTVLRAQALHEWKQLMNGYHDLINPDAEWRVKAQAWWNDPMHREWLHDAAIIASLPLIIADALAVSEGILSAGSTAKTALRSSLGKKPGWTKNVGRALQSRSIARSPGTHYDFPTHIRSKTQPQIPKWVFVENPYRQVVPGGRTWYWQEASSVRIKRTADLDKQLMWVLTGKGHF